MRDTNFWVRLTAAFLFLSLLTGCKEVPYTPAVEIAVYNTDATVKFQFLAHKKVAWFQKRIPHQATYLFIGQTVGNSSKIVWEIEAAKPATGVREITYGLLPPGFQQLHPKGNQSPPDLNTQGPYEVVVATLEGGGGIMTFAYDRETGSANAGR